MADHPFLLWAITADAPPPPGRFHSQCGYHFRVNHALLAQRSSSRKASVHPQEIAQVGETYTTILPDPKIMDPPYRAHTKDA